MYDRLMVKRNTVFEVLLSWHERIIFLHWIVTEDEKRIYFEKLKGRKSEVDLGPKPGETVNTVRYRQQMINLNHASI